MMPYWQGSWACSHYCMTSIDLAVCYRAFQIRRRIICIIRRGIFDLADADLFVLGRDHYFLELAAHKYGIGGSGYPVGLIFAHCDRAGGCAGGLFALHYGDPGDEPLLRFPCEIILVEEIQIEALVSTDLGVRIRVIKRTVRGCSDQITVS